ncbi:MAG: hypothetical protein MK479_09240 [Planctomycetes bacterium]|nr:hypothetical protein [Planctomycetota bacterium]
MGKRKKELGVAPDVQRGRRSIGVTLPKAGSRIPIGSRNDVPGSISIDISETGSLAEELIGENQAFEAMEERIGPEGNFLQEQKGQKDNNKSLLKWEAFQEHRQRHHELLAWNFPGKTGTDPIVSYESTTVPEAGRRSSLTGWLP